MGSPREVRQRMAIFLDVSPAQLGDDARLSDVVAESFLVVQLVIELQEAMGLRITAEDLRSVETVGDFVRVFEAAPEVPAPGEP